jgi:hypothetical protein
LTVVFVDAATQQNALWMRITAATYDNQMLKENFPAC